MKNPFEPGNIGIWATVRQFAEAGFARRVVQYWADYLPKSAVPADNEDGDYHYCFPREWLQFQTCTQRTPARRKPSADEMISALADGAPPKKTEGAPPKKTDGAPPKKTRRKPSALPGSTYDPFAFELGFKPLGRGAISSEVVNGDTFVAVTLAPFWLEANNSRTYTRVRNFSEIEPHLGDREASFYDSEFEDLVKEACALFSQDDPLPLMVVLGPKIYIDRQFSPAAAPTSFFEKKGKNLHRCTYRDEADNFHLYLGAWPGAKDLNMSEEESIAAIVLGIAPQIDRDLKDAKANLAAAEANVASIRRRLGSLTFLKNVTHAGFKDEFKSTLEKIRRDPRVASVQMQGIYTKLRTVPTFSEVTEDRRVPHFLGEFEFRFSIENGIEIRNLHLPAKDDRIHPHGWSDSVCLGTYQQVFNSCYANFDFYTLFLTLLEWVTDINPEDRRAVRSLNDIFLPNKPKVKKASPWSPFLTLDSSDTETEDDQPNLGNAFDNPADTQSEDDDSI